MEVFLILAPKFKKVDGYSQLPPVATGSSLPIAASWSFCVFSSDFFFPEGF